MRKKYNVFLLVPPLSVLFLFSLWVIYYIYGILVKIIETSIPDVKIIEPKVFGDERGFFLETFRDDWFKENIADVTYPR